MDLEGSFAIVNSSIADNQHYRTNAVFFFSLCSVLDFEEIPGMTQDIGQKLMVNESANEIDSESRIFGNYQQPSRASADVNARWDEKRYEKI